jgi:hypothetical protein
MAYLLSLGANSNNKPDGGSNALEPLATRE